MVISSLSDGILDFDKKNKKIKQTAGLDAKDKYQMNNANIDNLTDEMASNSGCDALHSINTHRVQADQFKCIKSRKCKE